MEVLVLSDKRTSKFSDPLRESDCEGVVVVPDDGDLTLVGYLDLLIETIRRLCRSKPNVIVGNYTGIVGLIAVVCGRLVGTPSVVRMGGDPLPAHRERRDEFRRRGEYTSVLKYTVLIFTVRVILRFASGFIVVSEDLKERVAPQVACPPSQIVVVRPSIDINRFHNDRLSPARTDEKSPQTVLTVTNFRYEGKLEGVRDSLSAMQPVLTEHEDVEYIVAGDGIYRDEAISYADRLFKDESVRQRIEFPGYVNEIDSLYREADVFLYVSYVDGYPNVVQEAQASGLPVVATPSYGVSEQIEDGDTGYLINAGDVIAISDAIVTLLDHPDERERIGQAARARVRTTGAPEVIGRKLRERLQTFVR
ncbi:glycosyltransferase [haloarchaeon 3A1-DGR]|nr:glycosyltransferase [haloarchaeon 3A1-DGR]